MRKIGVTGGIGSGKSTICALFNRLGVPIYDSDVRAKELANRSPHIIDGVKKLFGEESYLNGELQRKYVGSKVFTDRSLMAKLNGVIHPIVAEDFKQWCAERDVEGAGYVILESAILIESGFDSYVDEIICVTAPIETRVCRVMCRDGATREGVESRIDSQIGDQERCDRSQYTIANGDHDLIMPQIIKLNSIFTDEKI